MRCLQNGGLTLRKQKKDPEKYPKYIVGPFIVAQTGDTMKGISIMEVEKRSTTSKLYPRLVSTIKRKIRALIRRSHLYPNIYGEKREKLTSLPLFYSSILLYSHSTVRIAFFGRGALTPSSMSTSVIRFNESYIKK